MGDDPSYQLTIAPVETRPAVADEVLRGVIYEALIRHGAASARINVVLVDDAHIAELNERYLQHVGPTDVLTFDLRDRSDNHGLDEWALDAELVLSVETAAREARQRGHTPEAEAALYALHGTLHLLGYDDVEKKDAETMHALEDEILVALGMGVVYGSERR